MAAGVVRVQPDSTGKALETAELTVGGLTVERTVGVVGAYDDADAYAGVTAKGDQGAYGLAVQNLHDSGRTPYSLYTAAAVQATSTSTLLSLTGTAAGATVTPATAPAVIPAGQTLRIQGLRASYIATTTTGWALVQLRYNPSGVVTVTSPVLATVAVGAYTPTTANSMSYASADFPEGLEIPAGAGVGITVQGFSALAAANIGYVVADLTGFTY